MKKLFILFFLLCATTAFSQVKISSKPESASNFPLYSDGKACNIYIDASDYEVVKKVTDLFAEDIARVTGVKGHVSAPKSIKGKEAVIIGTLGRNKFIDNLVNQHKLDVSAIQNGWEQYIIKVVDNPCKGVDRALIIAGCDRRGTAYGTFALSEAMGVSPLYWWSDIPVKRQNALYLETSEYISKAPTVKYRGIFINDEGWGITPWAAKTFDPELGDIGPKTYAKVCELILRMKGNMLAPAMHPGSGAFNKYPENKVVADSYGIVMTSSHCEPLLFNNVTEWFKESMGDWNYITNKEGINKVLDKRISENCPYENFYTLAMRGIHDAGLVGVPKEREVSLVEEVLNDQRNILTKYIREDIDSIPQLFVPYKEVMDIYERGLKVPEYTTLVWPDDNFGYIKRLSNKEERMRKGGSGVYYHISYCGEPHDYLWINTTPSTLIYEEMRKAYDTGADRYWLLNVGDIKPGELGMKFFLDMAWDIHSFNFDNAYDFDAEFLASVFGAKYKQDLSDIMNAYYLLGFQHKPEAMGWGYEWNNHHDRERIIDTDFSFINYNEAEARMKEYDRIANKSEKILNSLPEAYKAAFYELVFYPVKGAALMNKKMLTAQQNRWYARQGRAATNLYAKKAQAYHDSLNYYTDKFNSLLNGKWNHMMSVTPGWTATYQNMPPVETLDAVQGEDMQIFIPGQDCTYGMSTVKVLPCINPYTKKNSFIELYNRGNKAFGWKATAKDAWILLSKTAGKTSLQDRITVSVDWTKVPVGTDITGEVEITSGGKTLTVYVPVFNPQSPSVAQLQGMYVEDNGCVSINAGKFHRKVENDQVKICSVKGLGYENDCVQLGEAAQSVSHMGSTDKTPKAEYDFYTFNGGNATVYVYALPLFPVDSKHDTRYGIMIDDGMVQWMTTSAKEYSSQWRLNVFRNSAVSVINMNVGTPGKHTFKLFCADPGMIIQKIVIDFGGMKRSYLGPDVTLVTAGPEDTSQKECTLGDTFSNPLCNYGPDPWALWHDSFYYYMHTMIDSLVLWRTKDITNVRNAEKKTIWIPVDPSNKHNLWAPEIHHIDGKWYIYYAADDGNTDNHQLYVLENANKDPFDGEFVMKGRISTDKDNNWAIDGSLFENKGKLYMVWSGWKTRRVDTETQCIYIAEMKNPWTLGSERVLISQPELEWERHYINEQGWNPPHKVFVNEGPQPLKSPQGKYIHVVYSASGVWTPYYALGMLTADVDSNLLDPASWKKSPKPLFRQSPENGVYGTGHNSFFKSPDGKEDYILYHARSTQVDPPGMGDTRNPRMQKIEWGADDYPVFGIPYPTSKRLKKPSGTFIK